MWEIFTEQDKQDIAAVTNPAKRVIMLLSKIYSALKNSIATKVTKVSSTNNSVVRFDGVAGEVQDSGVFISDNGYIQHERGWRDNIVQVTPDISDDTRWGDLGNGVEALKFSQNDFTSVNFHVNHDYAEGTNAYVHVHFVCKDEQQADSQVTIQVDYIVARGHSQGESLTAPTTSFQMTYTYTGSEVAGEHIILECDDTQAFDLKEPDSIICVKLTLVSYSTTSSIYVLSVDLHYLADRFVTLNRAPNFNV